MHLLEKLEQNRNLTLEEWQALIQKQSEYQKEAAKRARERIQAQREGDY